MEWHWCMGTKHTHTHTHTHRNKAIDQIDPSYVLLFAAAENPSPCKLMFFDVFLTDSVS